MIQLEERFEVSCHPREAYRYIATFQNAEEWNPLVRRIERDERGPAVEGESFTQIVGIGPLEAAYQTTVCSASTVGHLKLESRGPQAAFVDNILVEKTDNGCRVTWRVELEPLGASKLFEPIAEQAARLTGPNSIHRLREQLEAL